MDYNNFMNKVHREIKQSLAPHRTTDTILKINVPSGLTFTKIKDGDPKGLRFCNWLFHEAAKGQAQPVKIKSNWWKFRFFERRYVQIKIQPDDTAANFPFLEPV